MIIVTKKTSNNNICQPVYISTRGYGRFSYRMRYLVLLYWYWLKATNTNVAIGKYAIGRTPVFKRKTSAFLKIVKTAQQS